MIYNLQTMFLFFILDAWNESFASRIIINEICLYTVHPENQDWTCFEQEAELDIKSFFGFEGTAEKLAVKEYSKSIGKSKDIMEHYITILLEKGITDVPLWDPPPETEESKKRKAAIKTAANETSGSDQSGNEATAANATSTENKGEKSKLATERPLRRKSSNLRGDSECADGNKEATSKLEQDYIQMYLGQLTPIQESQLVQLKSWVSLLFIISR